MKKRISVAILALLLVLSMSAHIAPQQVNAAGSGTIKSELDALKQEKSGIDKKVAEIQAQITGNREEMAEIVAEKDLIDQEIALIHEQMTNLNEQITTYNRMIADKQEELTAAQNRLIELNEKYKERIRSMEENGDLSYWSVLFEASSFMDLLDRISMIDEIAEADSRRLQEISEAAAAVETAKNELEDQKAELEAAYAELNKAEEELDAKRAEADELLAALHAKGAEFEALLEDGEAEQLKLMQQIAATQKEYDAAKYKEWLATSVATTKPATNNNGGSTYVPSSAGWIIPCSYICVTSRFGYRIPPTQGASSYHAGVDLAAPSGTPIYASRAGQVTTTAFQQGGAGNYVSINHGDGFASIYMHMTHYIVKPGQVVSQGQVIGYVGSTGVSTGPHLHFGISYNGTYVNPANYINI